MIENKYLLTDPNYYVDWDIFETKFQQEAAFIYKEFCNLCKSKNTIYGKNEIMYILNITLPKKFPEIKTKFKDEFPDKDMDAVLGIGLWNSIDSGNKKWFWTNINDQNGNFQTKLYARK